PGPGRGSGTRRSLLDAYAPRLHRRREWGSSVSRHYRIPLRTEHARSAPGNANGRPGAAVMRRRSKRLLGVAALELVDAAAGVHHLVLAGIERVRGRGDLDLDQRVLVAVLPLDRLLAGDRRAGEELEVGSHVLEHDFAVFGVDVGLHVGTGFCWGQERHFRPRQPSPASPVPGGPGPPAAPVR